MLPSECIYQVSNWYLKACWRKVRKIRTDGRTDGRTLPPHKTSVFQTGEQNGSGCANMRGDVLKVGNVILQGDWTCASASGVAKVGVKLFFCNPNNNAKCWLTGLMLGLCPANWLRAGLESALAYMPMHSLIYIQVVPYMLDNRYCIFWAMGIRNSTSFYQYRCLW